MINNIFLRRLLIVVIFVPICVILIIEDFHKEVRRVWRNMYLRSKIKNDFKEMVKKLKSSWLYRSNK